MKRLMIIMGLLLIAAPVMAATPTPAPSPSPTPTPSPTPKIVENMGQFVNRVILYATDDTGQLRKVQCSTTGVLWQLSK